MKLMEKLRTKKADNKGFSLVELIIVIAIMAILIGIVGAQVIPWLENSRQAKDQQILSGLLTDAVGAFSSKAGELPDGTSTYTIYMTKGSPGTTTCSVSSVENAFKALHNAAGVEDLKFSSKVAGTIGGIKIEFIQTGTSSQSAGTYLTIYTDSSCSSSTQITDLGVFESL